MEIEIVELADHFQLYIIDWSNGGAHLGAILEHNPEKALQLGNLLRKHYDAILTSSSQKIHSLAIAEQITVHTAS